MLALNNSNILLLFQLIALAFEAKENLQNLGVFNEIDLMIDTSSGEELGTSALYFVFLSLKKLFSSFFFLNTLEFVSF